MSTVGLLLAAGRSERFGTANKLLAALAGEPLAAHAARAMRRVKLDHRLVVATDPAVAAVFDGFDVLMQPDLAAPQSASLAFGAEEAIARGADRLLVSLADMPLVDARLMSGVLERCADHRPAAATDGEYISPPACFPRPMLKALTMRSGDRGAGPLIRGLPPDALVRAPLGMLVDVDTVDDLARLHERYENGINGS